MAIVSLYGVGLMTNVDAIAGLTRIEALVFIVFESHCLLLSHLVVLFVLCFAVVVSGSFLFSPENLLKDFCCSDSGVLLL